MTGYRPQKSILPVLMALITLAMVQHASAQETPEDERETEEILVWGRAIDLVGAADSASEGIVGFDDLSTRPLLRVGELVEVIPGMIATQHSGGGKANQYFLRGINLDHGTDFSIQFEGMPVNFRTHAHGQGYLDMNFIIPELVKTIEYRKGTHSADVGDFSAASASKFETYDRLDAGFVQYTFGTEAYQRLVAANSWDWQNGTWLLGTELRFSDGPWENAEDVTLFNGFAKYSTNWHTRPVEITATAYRNNWNATDQIPLRAFNNGSLGRFSFIDPTVGGETSRYNLIATLTDDRTAYQAFVSSYALNLFGNPTYFLNDPVNGDQIEQEDRRLVAGGRVDHERELTWRQKDLVFKTGADLRYDAIADVNLFLTAARNRLSAVRNDAVDEFSLGAYADLQVNWTSKLRTSIGVRADHFRWDVDALRAANSGSGSDFVLNPKLSVAYNLSDQWEIYANYGGGFHSNDVRAAELNVDPVSGDPAEPFAAIVDAEGFETGFRAELSESLNFSVALFYLELDSELIFVGDAGTTEPNDGTERKGAELAVFWRPVEWLVVDASAAKTDARFRDAAAGFDNIPDANDLVGALGVTASAENGFVGSIRLRYFGDAPLVEDNSARKNSTALLNLGLSYPIGNVELGLDVLNLLDNRANDIEYFYESRLFDELNPVEDFHFHPVEPREFRFRIRYRFGN